MRIGGVARPTRNESDPDSEDDESGNRRRVKANSYRRIKDLRTAEDVREGMTYDEKYDLIEAAERKEEAELREATINSIEDYNAIQLTIIEDEESQLREAIERSTREVDEDEDDSEE